MKILCLADGFGDSQAYPVWYPDYFKWPRILGLMLKHVEILDFCRYGAGNEYLLWNLRQHHQHADVVLVQWAMPNRLDLLLHHTPEVRQIWQQKILQDPIYNDNIITVQDHQWWLSSASGVDWITQYHSNIMCLQQQQIRSMMFVEHAHSMLKGKSHGFMLTNDSDYLKNVDVTADTWIWHRPWHGMDSWRHHSEYNYLDLGLDQPIPLIHFDFIKKFIMPRFDLPWRRQRDIDAVESMLLRKFHNSIPSKPR